MKLVTTTAAQSSVMRASIGVLGFIVALALWWLAITALTPLGSLARQFSPAAALASLPVLVSDDHLITHALISLQRIGVGLGLALFAGVPLGLLLGSVKWLDAALSPTFQFLRMVSPLSWMPIAVMSLGVGDRSVYFLLGVSALWPLLMSTSAGVAHIDRRWLQLGSSLAATRREMLWHIVLPAIAASLLTGVRLGIGILWIVLVPAEMLGVNAGLGYLILDTRDRLAYSELTGVILIIGALGFLLDTLTRLAHARWVRTH